MSVASYWNLVGIVRASHLQGASKNPLVVSLIRGYALLLPMLALTPSQVLSQVSSGLVMWTAFIIISSPLYASISVGYSVPALPISRMQRVFGALLGVRSWELVPAGIAVLLLYSKNTPEFLLLKVVNCLILAALTGVIRSLIDDLAHRWPHLFGSSSLSAMALLPILIAIISTQLGKQWVPVTTIGLAPLLALIVLYSSFVNLRGPISLIGAVPGLTTVLYRRLALSAAVSAVGGSLVAFLIAGIAVLHSIFLALSIGALVVIWMALACGLTFLRGSLLLLLVSAFLGVPIGVIESRDSLLPLIVGGGVSVIYVLVGLALLRKVKDESFSRLWSVERKNEL